MGGGQSHGNKRPPLHLGGTGVRKFILIACQCFEQLLDFFNVPHLGDLAIFDGVDFNPCTSKTAGRAFGWQFEQIVCVGAVIAPIDNNLVVADWHQLF